METSIRIALFYGRGHAPAWPTMLPTRTAKKKDLTAEYMVHEGKCMDEGIEAENETGSRDPLRNVERVKRWMQNSLI